MEKQKIIQLYKYEYTKEQNISSHQAMVDNEGRFRGFVTKKKKVFVDCIETGVAELEYNRYVLRETTKELKTSGSARSELIKKLSDKTQKTSKMLGLTKFGAPIINFRCNDEYLRRGEITDLLRSALKKNNIELGKELDNI